MQTLLSGDRPRDPHLSTISTGRRVLEGLVEEVRIYRLHKEEEEEACAEKECERRRRRRISSRGRHGGEERENTIVTIIVIITGHAIEVKIFQETEIHQEMGVIGTDEAGGTNREMGVTITPDNEAGIAIAIETQ
jgi:hypothetical protein